jgi:pimeloyl-ACP methyl ester carboxylesterase
MKTPKIYFIPGMGANKDLFIHQKTAGFSMEVLEWIKPYEKESIEHYSARLAKNIDISEKFILAGVSFGGIVAVEIAKLLNPQKTILINSVATYKEYPLLLKFFSCIPLYRFTPQSAFSNSSIQKFLLYSMGLETDQGKQLFLEMLKSTDTVFIQWSIDALMNWRNTTIPSSLVRIHGKNDRIFPLKTSKNIHYYLRGGHSIILEDADHINSILHSIIESTLQKEPVQN